MDGPTRDAVRGRDAHHQVVAARPSSVAKCLLYGYRQLHGQVVVMLAILGAGLVGLAVGSCLGFAGGYYRGWLEAFRMRRDQESREQKYVEENKPK